MIYTFTKFRKVKYFIKKIIFNIKIKDKKFTLIFLRCDFFISSQL
jgi:hypothetical protein